MVSFPIDVFLPGADLKQLQARKHEFYDGLTRWQLASANGGAGKMLSVEAKTYEAALIKANNLFIDNLWGDGMPLWPATRARVDWILRGTPYPRTRILGKFPTRGAVATIESCAIALAMAGGRPEYLPVLVGAVEAFLDPDANTEQMQANSGAPFPVVVVNGPIGNQIRLNSGFGCLGPDPQHAAGASIGRALRQMQQNLGGAVPAIGTMAIFGPMRYTNVVIAEDEEGLPPGWASHATERHGYARGENSISLTFATGAANVKRRGAGKETPEEDAIQGLNRIAGFLATPHLHYTSGYDDGTPGVILLSSTVAGALATLGWDKKRIQDYLWENSKIPMDTLRAAGGPGWIEISPTQEARDSLRLDPWPITSKPENIAIVVAGGRHFSHAFWLQGYSDKVTGRKIALPEKFDELLAEYDKRDEIQFGDES